VSTPHRDAADDDTQVLVLPLERHIPYWLETVAAWVVLVPFAGVALLASWATLILLVYLGDAVVAVLR
jgi:hypothetical protein